MIEHIFKYVYGEKPLCAKEKPRRGDFANVALNSYSIYKYHSVVILTHICYTMSVVLFYKEEF